MAGGSIVKALGFVACDQKSKVSGAKVAEGVRSTGLGDQRDRRVKARGLFFAFVAAAVTAAAADSPRKHTGVVRLDVRVRLSSSLVLTRPHSSKSNFASFARSTRRTPAKRSSSMTMTRFTSASLGAIATSRESAALALSTTSLGIFELHLGSY